MTSLRGFRRLAAPDEVAKWGALPQVLKIFGVGPLSSRQLMYGRCICSGFFRARTGALSRRKWLRMP